MHRELKALYASDNGRTEQRVENFVVDVLTDDRIYEIQTSNFNALKNKLAVLLQTHAVTVVYPIAIQKTLVKRTKTGEQRRKSPRHGRATDIFEELVHMPTLLDHPNLHLELIYVRIEEYRHFDEKRAWRRRHWVISERKLLGVDSRACFKSMQGLFDEFAAELPTQFTTSEIATSLSVPRRLAQKMAYCFRAAKVIVACGKRGNAIVYCQQT